MGSDNEMEETTEEINMTVEEIRNEPKESGRVPRCRRCRRMCFGHDGPTGMDKCKLDIVEDEEELRDEDDNNHKVRESTRRSKALKRKSSTETHVGNEEKKIKDNHKENDAENERLKDVLKKKREETERIRKEILKEEEEQSKLYKGGKPRTGNEAKQTPKLDPRNENPNEKHQSDDVRRETRRNDRSFEVRDDRSFDGRYGRRDDRRNDRRDDRRNDGRDDRSFDQRNERRDDRSHGSRDEQGNGRRNERRYEERNDRFNERARNGESRSKFHDDRSSVGGSIDRESFHQPYNDRYRRRSPIQERDNYMFNRKVADPPTWGKDDTFAAWKRRIELWDEEHDKPERKANVLMEFIKKDENHKDVAEILQQEVIENPVFKWKNTHVVGDILKIIEETVEESMWTRNVDASKELIAFKQADEEDDMKYIHKFGRLEGKLKNSKAGMSNIFLATIFLNQSRLNQLQKENIMAMVDLNDEKTVLINIKKKFRTLKASSTKSKEEPKAIFYGNDGQGDTGSYRREGFNRERSTFRERNGRSACKGGRDKSREFRGRNRSQSRGRFRSGDRSFRGGHRSQSRDKYRNQGVKNVLKCSKLSIDQSKSIFENEVENLAVVDSGCPEPVVGKAWLRTFETSTDQIFPVIEKKETFKFGDDICEAEYYKEIPIELGKMKKTMKVAVVDTNIPLLLSLETLTSWGAILDFAEQTIKLKTTGETFKLDRTKSNHLAIALSKRPEVDKEELLRRVFKVKKVKKYQFKELKKIHRIFGHPRPEKLEKIFKDSGLEDKGIMRKIGRVFECCKICRKYQRKDSKPKVGLPKASSVNECVSIDLKPVSSLTGDSSDKRQIVYCVCELSRYTKAGISRSKESEDVVSVLLNTWCLDGPGYPSNSFFMDNGNEFAAVEFVAKRLEIKVKMGPSYSPWSNGTCERRHASVDLTIKKLMEDNDKLPIEDALQHALWARNVETGRLGDTPFRIMFGRTPVFPGITDGNLVTDNSISGSEAVKQHFEQMEKARIIYRQADCSRRIKEALKSRMSAYHDRVYKVDEEIIFLDKDDQWTGPGKVKAVEGKTLAIWYNGNLRKVATCRARPMVNEVPDAEDSSSEEEGTMDEESEVEECSDNESNTGKVNPILLKKTPDGWKNSDTLPKGWKDKHPEVNIEFGQETKETRPKRGKMVKFKMFAEDEYREGTIQQVGKQSGRDRNTCWVLENGKTDSTAIDFMKDVETWSYKIFFAENANKENYQKTMNDKHMEAKAVLFMKMKEPVEVLATAVKPSEYNHPEVVEAMSEELDKWIKYEAYTTVDTDTIPDDADIIDTTWNINRKEKHDGLKVDIKARLCIRGFKKMFHQGKTVLLRPENPTKFFFPLPLMKSGRSRALMLPRLSSKETRWTETCM